MVLPQANTPKHLWKVAFLARSVDKSARCKGRSIQGSKARACNEQGKNERAYRAEDLRPKGYGNGVGGLDDRGREYKKVGYVCENVAEYDERKRSVDYTGEVTGGVFELGSHIIDLGMLVMLKWRQGNSHTLSQPSKAHRPA